MGLNMGYYRPIKEHQMEKTIENEMETGLIG